MVKIPQVYPALARARSDLFGICLVDTRGNVAEVGHSNHEFSIMSVSKPFVFALVCQKIGPTLARNRIGVNGTGLPFNSLTAIETKSRRSHQSHGQCWRDSHDQPCPGR